MARAPRVRTCTAAARILTGRERVHGPVVRGDRRRRGRLRLPRPRLRRVLRAQRAPPTCCINSARQKRPPPPVFLCRRRRRRRRRRHREPTASPLRAVQLCARPVCQGAGALPLQLCVGVSPDGVSPRQSIPAAGAFGPLTRSHSPPRCAVCRGGRRGTSRCPSCSPSSTATSPASTSACIFKAIAVAAPASLKALPSQRLHL